MNSGEDGKTPSETSVSTVTGGVSTEAKSASPATEPEKPFRPRAQTRSAKALRRDERKNPIRLPSNPERPKTRGECKDGIRPCPFVSCRYNLYLDITPAGSLKINKPGVDPDEVTGPSCALDVADEGEHTLEAVGEIMNLTRERTRQLIAGVREKIEPVFGDMNPESTDQPTPFEEPEDDEELPPDTSWLDTRF